MVNLLPKRKLFLALLLVFVFVFSSLSQVYAQIDELYFLHTDHLGSTRAVTDRNGNVVARYDYYPYGTINNQQLTINNQTIERLFTSQIYDSDSFLYFYNARYYDPATGIFISPDPIQGPNRYAYVSDNPINIVDTSGNQEIKITNPVGRFIHNNIALGSQFVASLNIPVVSSLAAYDVENARKLTTAVFADEASLPQRVNLAVEGYGGLINEYFTVFGAVLTGQAVWETGKASMAQRAAEKAEYLKAMRQTAEEYGVTWTEGSPGGAAAGCIKTLGEKGREILPGTQLHQLEVVAPPHNVVVAGHEAGPGGHLTQAISKAFTGAPDVALGAKSSLSRIGYEIQANWAGMNAGIRYATTPREFLSVAAQTAGLFWWETSGGGFLYRTLGVPGVVLHTTAVVVGEVVLIDMIKGR